MVRKLITSASMPSLANSSAAAKALPTISAKAVMVTCLPGRSIFARPIGKTKSSPSGTSELWPYMISFSRKITGLGSRIAAFSKPLASAAFHGATTLRPGQWAYQLA